ncbi:hypothetical protein AUJ40_01310 [Candidatus Berkelbacteria bacterium CG1_02_42_45]|uniref:Isomerase n=2 Tax=Candidatus Berkelbacteria TaxID=1618330 RepID=A0A2M7K209_9BACT|nr:MAG: hypothetical protein AUJ40_01310 [Candidatus Berkelbacteria bacterium CG1_02_42_45]PIX30286.1 MAG: isomerase [Candidatus Berkelbacteria bacterium CG_4_8_14_3_um_filter_42_13]
MTVFESHKKEPWFSLIGSRQKSIEGRLRKGKYAKIKPGDYILVYSPGEKDCLKVKVLAVRYYDSFKDMLEREKLTRILPGVKNIETGIETYNKIYSREDEKNFGVAAIEIELLG